MIALNIHKGLVVEIFRIDDGGVDIGEQFKFVGAADIVAVARCAVGDNALTIDMADLIRLKRLDHAVLRSHAADPLVGFDAHVVERCVNEIAMVQAPT